MKGLFIVVFSLLLTGCSQAEMKYEEPDNMVVNETESYTYTVECEDELMAPSVTLSTDGMFSFGYDPLSSYMSIGTYEHVEDTYVMTTNDGKYKYVFQEDEDGLRFVQEGSSEVKLINSDFGVEIKDGTLFVKDN